MSSARYFEHTWSDSPFRISAQTCLRGITVIVERLLGQSLSDPSVYTGEAGIAYALLRVATCSGVHFPLRGERELEREAVWEKLLSLIRRSVAAVRHHSERHHGWSLFCGHTGIYVTAARVHHEVRLAGLATPARDEKDRALRKFEGVAELVRFFDTERVGDPADEMLYGRAGYLMAVLLLEPLLPQRRETVHDIVRALLDSGKFQAAIIHRPSALFYTWPRGERARPYLGAAHGLMGILYVLLHFVDVLEAMDELATVRATVMDVLQYETDTRGELGSHGCYPTALDSTRAPLVHWCHGSTGAVFLFCKAYEVFGSEAFLEAAIRAGEVVYRRGLLKKGPGLCHGVAGNGYALLKLYKVTQDEKYLQRASRFAEFMLTPEFEAARVPDSPWSLYEGWAGALCFFVDLLDPLHAKFPFFEI